MDFTSFKEAVRSEIERRIGNCTVALNDVRKNNGVSLSGLTINSNDSNIAPVIYLNNYYSEYETGYMKYEDIIGDILTAYEKSKVDCSIDMSSFLNYESVKKKIVYKLINTDMNAELLQHIPHIAFHDLSIVFQVMISEENCRHATILVHNEHLKLWNVSLDELKEDARINTPILNKYEIRNMEDIISELMPMKETEHLPVPLLVLSNKNKLYGAACMLYPDLLKHVSDKTNSSMYIIPSSIHEVLLRPTKKLTSSEYLNIREMVSEVNNTQVEEEEILSYSVYFYDKDADKIFKL